MRKGFWGKYEKGGFNSGGREGHEVVAGVARELSQVFPKNSVGKKHASGGCFKGREAGGRQSVAAGIRNRPQYTVFAERLRLSFLMSY